jgi:hypothetical protein
VDQSADSFVIAEGSEIHTGDYKLEVGTGQTTIHGNVSACGGLSATEAPNYFACNVGINTNWPTSYLQVSALKTIDRDLVVICGGGSGGDYDGLRVEAGNGTHLFRVNQLTYDVLTPSTGKVGIGNTAPGQKLTVSGNVSACGGLSATKGVGYFACKVGIGTCRPAETLHVDGNILIPQGKALRGYYGNSIPFDIIGMDSTTDTHIYGANNNSSDIFFDTCSGGTLQTRMTILNNGCVGIGTTAPNEKLTVAGNISACGGLSATQMNSYFACKVGIGISTPTADLHIKDASGDPTQILLEDADGGTQTAKIVFDQTAQNSLVLSTQYQSSTDLNLIQFAPADNVAMTIRGGTGSSDGNVSPNQKLTVSGNISALGSLSAGLGEHVAVCNSSYGGFISGGRDLADIFETCSSSVDGSGNRELFTSLV